MRLLPQGTVIFEDISIEQFEGTVLKVIPKVPTKNQVGPRWDRLSSHGSAQCSLVPGQGLNAAVGASCNGSPAEKWYILNTSSCSAVQVC